MDDEIYVKLYIFNRPVQKEGNDCKIEVKSSINFQLGSLRMAQFVKLPFIVFRLARYIFRYYCLRAQYTIPTNNLSPETCRVMFTKMTPKSKFLLAHLKMAQLVKIPFIVFHLARLKVKCNEIGPSLIIS